MWKSNFSFFQKNEKELYELCEGAEIMLNKNSNITMYMLRQFIESLCRNIIKRRKLKCEINKTLNLDGMINFLKNSKIIDDRLSKKFNSIRRVGNKAVHDIHKSHNDASIALEDSYKIAVWYYKNSYQLNFNPDEFSLDNIKVFDEKDLAYIMDRQMNIISGYLEKSYTEASDLNKSYLESIEVLKKENQENIKKITEQQQNILNDFLKELNQKYGRFNNNDNTKFQVSETNNVQKNVNNSAFKEEAKKTRGIGNFVKYNFNEIFENNLINEDLILNLQDKNYSKKIFNLSSFPVIKKLEKNKSIDEQRIVNGHARFYNIIFKFNNEQYILCSQWIYEKHYEKLKDWFNNINHGIYEFQTNNINKPIKNKEIKEERTGIADKYLMRLIHTIGMSTFVKYYEYFKDVKNTEDKIIDLFKKNDEGYMESSSRTKAYTGKRIFAENLNSIALKVISKASKVDYITAKRAKELMEE